VAVAADGDVGKIDSTQNGPKARPRSITAPTSRRSQLRAAFARDRFTLWRLIVLVTCEAMVFGLFADDIDTGDAWTDFFRAWSSIALLGLSMPGPLFAVGRRWAGQRLGPGALLWLSLGLGFLLMLPPAVKDGEALSCLYYVLPLMSLWFVLAAAVGGRMRLKYLGPRTAWTERFGFYLGLLWSPLGVWLLWDFYRDAFF
jgi:hypothetical protein